jgi:alkanesulfonate monooxygenase SsuD/methylene tetrahydromethanopterin reductase-like flavin-dependent oxidoreductase (luciferase family)
LPMALAIIGGSPDRFVPYANYYRETAKAAGHDLSKLAISVHSHAYIADSSQQAADEFYPSYSLVMSRLGKERGWPPMSREQYDMMREPAGSLVVGDPLSA